MLLHGSLLAPLSVLQSFLVLWDIVIRMSQYVETFAYKFMTSRTPQLSVPEGFPKNQMSVQEISRIYFFNINYYLSFTGRKGRKKKYCYL